MIEICKTTTPSLHSFIMENPGAFYVGRGRGSALGNPFLVAANEAYDVAYIVAVYRNYLNKILGPEKFTPHQAAAYCEMEYGVTRSDKWKCPTRNDVIDTLIILKRAYGIQDIKLVCFCVNKAFVKQDHYDKCHAEVVAAAVIWMYENNINAEDLN